MSDYIIRKSNKLLGEAQKFFGEELITKAWVVTYNSEDEEYIDENLWNGSAYDHYSKENKFDLEPGCDFILEFVNGKQFLFTISEWGSIQKVDVTQYESRP